MHRNDFLKKALAGTAALFAVNWGTLAQIRAYKIDDKPLLTEANLNRFFTKAVAENNLTSFEEAAGDTPAFLKKHFSISPEQEKTIARIKKEEWSNIQSILNDARKDKGLINFKFENARGRCDTQVRLLQKEAVIKNGVKREKVNTSELKTVELKKVVIQ